MNNVLYVVHTIVPCCWEDNCSSNHRIAESHIIMVTEDFEKAEDCLDKYTESSLGYICITAMPFDVNCGDDVFEDTNTKGKEWIPIWTEVG